MSYLEEVKSVLKDLKPGLSEKYGVNTLGLFGSIVRDDFTENSDIDIVNFHIDFHINWPVKENTYRN